MEWLWLAAALLLLVALSDRCRGDDRRSAEPEIARLGTAQDDAV